MNTDTRVLTCTECEATAPVPEDGNHTPLWQAGWRWLGSWKLFSCPACPPLLLVAQGRHTAGPGLA